MSMCICEGGVPMLTSVSHPLKMGTLLQTFVVFLFGLMQVTSGKPALRTRIEEALQKHNTAKKTTPFPKIQGPKCLDDSIAIVGAGPSGIHMAYQLKKAGFKKVTVFEKNDYIGGKSKTLYHKRVPHEMGTCYTQPDYTAIYDLINEFDTGKILPLPGATEWVERNTSAGKIPVPLTFTQYIVSVGSELYPAKNQTELLGIFLGAVQKYVTLHTERFGAYEGELMPRPSASVLEELNVTFLDFLKAHDIEILKAVFLPVLTVQGYGHVANISALYGMMWNTPNFLTKLTSPQEPSDDVADVNILEKGYQFLWQEISRQMNLDVRLSSPVVKIKRRDGFFKVFYRHCRRKESEFFDFVILSPAMQDMAKIFLFNREERNLFDKTFHYYYTTTLVDTTLAENRGLSPHNYYAFNVESRADDLVWVNRNSYQTLVYRVGENYTDMTFPGAPDGDPIQSTMYYQFSERKPNPDKLEAILVSHIENFENATIVDIIDQIVWPYFPRYSVSDLATGILWDIFNIQGKHGIWYIGSSVSFESVKSVVEYNKLMLRHYDIPLN